MRPRQHINAVDLEQPQAGHQPAHMAGIRLARPRIAEALGPQRDTPRLRDTQLFGQRPATPCHALACSPKTQGTAQPPFMAAILAISGTSAPLPAFTSARNKENFMPDAPGGPGIPPRWTSSDKSGVGTALSATSRVWFTISHGILNECYYPRVDQALHPRFWIDRDRRRQPVRGGKNAIPKAPSRPWKTACQPTSW